MGNPVELYLVKAPPTMGKIKLAEIAQTYIISPG